MKKSTKIILSLFIILFTISIIPKDNSVQNDTFFDIAIGNYIMENGIDMMEHWTWHTDLTYIYSHWLFDVFESIIYNLFDFIGIYIFVLIISSITVLTIFWILIKKGHSVSLSFIITLVTAYFCTYAFIARTQVITFWLFILESYFIGELVETNKKRYCIFLLIIPIIIANIHSGLWVLTFIFYLPYIAEFIISKIIKNDKEDTKIIVENHNIKLLMITFILTIFTGLLTPLGDVPYTAMFKSMTGLATQYVAEMQSMILIEYWSVGALMAIFIGLIFTKTKYKLVDLLYFVGFLVMSLSTIRSAFYLFFIGAFIIANLLESFLKEYHIDIRKYENNFFRNKKVKVFASFLGVALIIHLYIPNISAYYYDESAFPTKICEYISKNVDIDNMKIYNGYNYGSYLEFCEIPAFMDSRAEVFLAEFNDTTILEDFCICENGGITYEELFEKYGITHVLIYKSGTVYTYISQDENYELLCEEDNFVFYLRKT